MNVSAGLVGRIGMPVVPIYGLCAILLTVPAVVVGFLMEASRRKAVQAVAVTSAGSCRGEESVRSMRLVSSLPSSFSTSMIVTSRSPILPTVEMNERKSSPRTGGGGSNWSTGTRLEHRHGTAGWNNPAGARCWSPLPGPRPSGSATASRSLSDFGEREHP